MYLVNFFNYKKEEKFVFFLKRIDETMGSLGVEHALDTEHVEGTLSLTSLCGSKLASVSISSAHTHKKEHFGQKPKVNTNIILIHI